MTEHKAKRIEEYRAQLMHEGWPYHLADSRAREAYLEKATKRDAGCRPCYVPESTPGFREALVLEHAQRTVDLEGETPEEAERRRKEENNRKYKARAQEKRRTDGQIVRVYRTKGHL